MLTTIRKPSWPPGRLVSRCSTQLGPSTPWNDRLNTVEPIRMKSTKHDSFIVVSIAWRSSFRSRRRRASAITSAPTAPIAPPSVGVAMPRKIVPSTRKISASGGISTKVTRSAMRDSRLQLEQLVERPRARTRCRRRRTSRRRSARRSASSPGASSRRRAPAPTRDHEQDAERAQARRCRRPRGSCAPPRQRRRPARPARC